MLKCSPGDSLKLSKTRTSRGRNCRACILEESGVGPGAGNLGPRSTRSASVYCNPFSRPRELATSQGCLTSLLYLLVSGANTNVKKWAGGRKGKRSQSAEVDNRVHKQAGPNMVS